MTFGSQLLQPRCPNCGKGKVFAKLLKLNDTCPACGLKFEHRGTDDGPTYFTILILGFVVMTLATIVEHQFKPPLWVHAALWIPLTFIACIFSLRLFKTWMVKLEFRLHTAENLTEKPDV